MTPFRSNFYRFFAAVVAVSVICMFLAVSKTGEADREIAGFFSQYRAGHYETALGQLKKIQKRIPDSNQIDYNLGNTMYRLGCYQQARQAWQKALKEARKPALRHKILYNTANAFYREVKFRQAAAYYRRALAVLPEDESARFNLGLALARISRSKKTARQKIGSWLDGPKTPSRSETSYTTKAPKRAPADRTSTKRPDQSWTGLENGHRGNLPDEKITPDQAVRWLQSIKEGNVKYLDKRVTTKDDSSAAGKDW